MNHRITLLNLIIKHLLPLEETHGMHIFLDDSPHVKWIDYRVYAEKWDHGASSFLSGRLSYDPEGISRELADEKSILDLRESLIHEQTLWLASKEERRLKAIQELEDKLKELKK